MSDLSYDRLPQRHADGRPGAASAATTLPGGLRIALRGIARLFRDWQVRARERSAAAVLYALPDHTLRDIGIHRSQIRHIARAVAENPAADPRALRR